MCGLHEKRLLQTQAFERVASCQWCCLGKVMAPFRTWSLTLRGYSFCHVQFFLSASCDASAAISSDSSSLIASGG